ncbi:MAG: hypothetical protein LBQ05_02170, partial [Christensenellaceae bacterium]|nr:hypothetical protein [Christensenellaceae bacterium]
DGLTPYIGTNNNWWIGNTDTGVSAVGQTGATGAKGDKGDKGDAGSNGADGNDLVNVAIPSIAWVNTNRTFNGKIVWARLFTGGSFNGSLTLGSYDNINGMVKVDGNVVWQNGFIFAVGQSSFAGGVLWHTGISVVSGDISLVAVYSTNTAEVNQVVLQSYAVEIYVTTTNNEVPQ